ncbi:MAG: hypothetical protein K0S57_2857 [Ramlibacter sp.]|nr:hypothetical protein [Ramlibacter sp.]
MVLGGYRADYDVSWNATAKTYTLVHRASGFTTTTKAVEQFQFSAEYWGSSYDWGNLIPDATAGDGYRLIGTADNNLLEGSAGFDYLSGGEGDDILNGFQQNDSLYGGGGKVVLGGYRADYDVSWNATAKTYTLVHRASGFTTTAKAVEEFGFGDGTWNAGDLLAAGPVGVAAAAPQDSLFAI